MTSKTRTTEDVLTDLTNKYQGRKIKIRPLSKHPHRGEEAEIICYEKDGNGEPGMKVKNDTGEFFVYTNKDYYLLSYHAPGNLNIGRNEPCLCGSGKKYKHCCISLNH